MTTRTKNATGPQPPDERALQLRTELADLDAEEQRRHQADAVRLAQHQADFDAAIVADYDRAAFDAEVVAARQALQQAIAEDPLTKALTGYYRAGARRREAHDEYIGVLARQGRDVNGVQHPAIDDIGVRDVLDVMAKTATTAASDWRIQAEADFHHRRNTPITKGSTK